MTYHMPRFSIRSLLTPQVLSLILGLVVLTVFVEWLLYQELIAPWVGHSALIGLVIFATVIGLYLKTEAPAPQMTEAEHKEAVSSLADFATDVYWETDLYGFVIDAGGRLMPALVDDVQDLIGQHYLSIVHLEDREKRRMQKALNVQEPYSDIQSIFRDTKGRVYYISLSATPRFDRAGRITGYLGVGTNMTERVVNARKLKHMAEHDMLTGLANRYRFSDQIKTDLRSRNVGNCLSLLAIDLDGFKQINDEMGHQAGDALLNLVGKRVRAHIRSQDWAARMGGDEFVVVSRGVANPMEACLLAARLSAKLSQPYQVGGEVISVTASIGIACAPTHASDADTLMKCADIALYQAKGDGRNCYRLYEAEGADEHQSL